MSIINEALKKAGQQPASPETKGDFRPELLKKKKRMNWGPLFVMSVLTLITAPILAPLFHNPYVSAGTSAPRPPAWTPMMDKLSSSNMKAQFGIEEAPLAHLPAAAPVAVRGIPAFALNGLVYSNEGSYCLINKKVVKLGEQIGGATLVRVTPTEAILNYQGEKIILPANV